MTAPAWLTVETSAQDSTGAYVTLQFVHETAADRERRRKGLVAEAKAWRLVAGRIAGRGLVASGLCAELGDAYATGAIRVEVETAAEDRLWLHRSGSVTFWLGDESRGHCIVGCSPDDEAAQSRLMFALLLALECEDEARSLAPLSRRSRGTEKTNAKRGKR